MEKILAVYEHHIVDLETGKEILASKQPEDLAKQYFDSICNGTLPGQHELFLALRGDSRIKFERSLREAYKC